MSTHACYSDFDGLKVAISSSTSQRIFTICPNSVLQMDKPFSSRPSIFYNLAGATIQCGENGSGSGCIFEQLASANGHSFFGIEKPEVQLLGLTFRNALGDSAVEVTETSASARFEGCIFENNGTPNEGVSSAVYVGYGAAAIFSNCHFQGNSGRRVIYADGSISVDHCTFENNTSTPLYVRSQTNFGLDPAELALTNSCFENNSGEFIVQVLSGTVLNVAQSNYGNNNTATGSPTCDAIFQKDGESCNIFDAGFCGPKVPSQKPSASPSISIEPSISPSAKPSVSPSKSPSAFPTAKPSGFPSASPTGTPSKSPSGSPTVMRSESPSASPSALPTTRPVQTTNENPTISSSYLPKISIASFAGILICTLSCL